MQTFDKEVKVGKIQRYTFDVTKWLAGDALISASATVEGLKVTVSACDISAGVIGFFATGVSVGRETVHLSYATSTQSDCDSVGIIVEEC